MAVIRETRQFRTTPIGVVRSDRGEERMYNSISNAADNILGMATKEAARVAEKKSKEAALSVSEIDIRTIDPTTGKPVALTLTPKSFGTIARDNYEQVINSRYRSGIENDIKLKASELAIRYDNDPRAVEKYSIAMSGYISEMSKNATGQFKAFTEETGTYYLASTKLNLIEKANKRQLAQTAANVSEDLDTKNQGVFDAAAAGVTDEEVDLLIANGVQLATNAEGANLFQAGSRNAAADNLMANAAKGTAESLLVQPMSTQARTNILLAISNKGLTLDRVPVKFRSAVARINQLTNNNNRNDVLSFTNAKISDYNAADAYTSAEAARNASQKTNVAAWKWGSALSEGLSDAAMTGNPANFEGALANTASRYEELLNDIESRFNALDPTVRSDAALANQKQDLRQQTLRSVLLEAAKDGNIQQLQTAMVRGDASGLGLTEKQESIVGFLSGNPLIYNVIDDVGYATSLIGGSQDDVAKRIAEDKVVIQLNRDISNMSANLVDGTAIEGEAIALFNSIEDNPFLTANQKIGLQASMRQSQGIGVANRELNGMSSTAVNAMALYVDTKGRNDLGLTPAMKETADKILEGLVWSEDAPTVVQHINTISNRISENESANAATIKAANLLASVTSGQPNSANKDARQMADVAIAQIGNDPQFLLKAASVNESVYAIARNTLPQSMIDGLTNLANGQSVAGADVLLQHYLNLSNDFDPLTGVTINRFAQTGGLNDDDIAFLDTVSLLTNNFTGTQNIAEVAQKLRDAERNAGTKANLDSMFDGNYTKWTTEYVGDVYAASKLKPLVKYLAISGLSQDAIKERLDVQMDKVFVKTEGYVRDPRFSIDNYSRSEYSLARVIPDPEARKEFVNIINSQLPIGYKLYSNRDVDAAKVRAGRQDIKYTMTDKQIVLVPDQSAGTEDVTYYAYTVGEDGELKPLIYNSRSDGSGVNVLPSWDKSELDGFYKSKQVQINANFTQEQNRASSSNVREYGLRRTNPFGYYPAQPSSSEPQVLQEQTSPKNTKESNVPKGMSELRYRSYLRNLNINLSESEFKGNYTAYKNSQMNKAIK
jgi:hypothetical protein